jgi:uncharacterized membrane protein YfcA
MVDVFLAEIAHADFAWVVLGALLAGVVRGLTGFGAAMILVPILSAVLGPAIAIPALTAVDALTTAPLLVDAVKRCRWREVLPLAAAATLALPLGVSILIHVDPETLRTGISCAILVLVAVIGSGWRYSKAPSLPLTAAVGAASGLMGGATGMSGPPVILFWLGGQNEAVLVRANINVFFGLMAVTSMIAFWIGGLYDLRVIVITLAMAPIYGGAVWLGARGFRHASDTGYRRFALALITAIAVTSLMI